MNTNYLILIGIGILIGVAIYYGYVLNNNDQQIISLINGTDGAYDRIGDLSDDVADADETSQFNQNTICYSLEKSNCEEYSDSYTYAGGND